MYYNVILVNLPRGWLNEAYYNVKRQLNYEIELFWCV